MPAMLLTPRGRASATADAIGGSVELAAVVGIPLAIVVFIAIILVIYSSKSSSDITKESEVREASRETMYDQLAKEQKGQNSARDHYLDDEEERAQMGTGRSLEAESEGLLTAPHIAKPS
ncbi:hypothetical protein QBC41DRAFT_306964 [Cercophora samala]|uniref:Uncharacterized protein n=1 Tax=Cercophora samala TaxID=330535 RepID=A0AA40D607_9PEZI|nr:hypothetical protein QBC41DRAFT_306964 [Cercophora samala]